MRLSLVSLAGCGLFASAPDPACPTDRTIVLASQGDVGAFVTCKAASSVAIRTGETIDVASLTKLDAIAGDLAIGPTVGVEEIDLTELREVGGTVRVHGNGSLRRLFLPRLERAGRIEVDDNATLGTIALPRLAEVGGGLVITNNRVLAFVDASALASVGKSLVIAGQPKLTLVEMPLLAHAETVTIADDPKLSADVASALTAKATVALPDRPQ